MLAWAKAAVRHGLVVLLIDSLEPRDVDQERGDAFSRFSKEPWRPGADLRRSSSRRTKRIRRTMHWTSGRPGHISLASSSVRARTPRSGRHGAGDNAGNEHPDPRGIRAVRPAREGSRMHN